jgi:membrane protease YdiL (CAAX protease family)
VRGVIDAYRRVVPYVGLVGLAAAVAVRVRIAGAAGAQSQLAGIWFAVALGVVALATRDRDRVRGELRLRALLAGVAGAAVLCLPAAIRHVLSGTGVTHADGYVRWALIVVVVAVAEEALLRGSLYATVEQRAGTATAIAVTSVAFGLLHAPVYGWAVVPLDVAVGVWLGVLRAVTGSVAAPAVAHALADLAGWWLR